MLIFPAIDLRAGQVVRLAQGDYGRMSVYGENPLEVAKGFAGLGATCLHVVDLDGAKDGSPGNRGAVQSLCGLPLFTQVGGGMRTARDVEQALSFGAGRVILGTAAVENFPLVQRLANAHGEKIAVGVDVKDGFVAVRGWMQKSDITGPELCLRLRDAGIETVIFTDVARDGQLMGANLSAYEALSKIQGLQIIASGGVSEESEILRLKEMNLYGVILGKALYTGRISLARALAIAKGENAPC